MNRFVIYILLFLPTGCLFAQKMNSRDKLQGVWETTSIRAFDYQDSHSYEYEVYRNNDKLYLHFESDTLGTYYSSKFGFSPKDLKGIDSVPLDSLSDYDGFVLVEYDDPIVDSLGVIHGFVLEYGFKDYDNYYRCSSDICCYRKSAIPTPYLVLVKEAGTKDGIDYLKKYFGTSLLKVSVQKAAVFDNSFHQTKNFFYKNDVVELVKEEGQFFKIFYRSKDDHIVEGFIKKNNVYMKW